MKLRTDPREFKIGLNLFSFKSRGNFLFEDDQFIFHFWINIPLILSRPESPKCVANDVSFARFLFSPKDIISKFDKIVLTL